MFEWYHLLLAFAAGFLFMSGLSSMFGNNSRTWRDLSEDYENLFRRSEALRKMAEEQRNDLLDLCQRQGDTLQSLVGTKQGAHK